VPLKGARREENDALVKLYRRPCVRCTLHILAGTQGVSIHISWQRRMCSLCLTAYPCAGYRSASYIKSDVEQSFTGVEFIRKYTESKDAPIL